MPPEYHLQSFWDERFGTESHFEWLGDGQDTLLPPLRSYMRAQLDSDPGRPPPPVLHIGAGTSSLSDRVREAYRDAFGDDVDEGVIVNVDFSETAVQKGVETEMARRREGGGHGMRWVRADVLRWDDLAPLAKSSREGPSEKSDGATGGPFELVLDKSTSDAISCGEHVVFSSSADAGCHPVLRRRLATSSPALHIHPVDLLALHLAALVRPGGLWMTLSFSSNRFPFLGVAEDDTNGGNDRGATDTDPACYWTLEELMPVEAPSGHDRPGVHTPIIHHYVYVLKRTETEMTS